MSFGITPSAFQEEWQFLNRVYMAQVTFVDETSGRVSAVVIDGTVRKEERLELPFTGFSINRFRSSWVRYMPQRGDHVLIAYGPHNEARIVAFTSGPDDAYASVIRAREAGEVSVVDDDGQRTQVKTNLGDFADIRSGEWDMRSKGGAYIYGDVNGALLLSGGQRTFMRFDKTNAEARGDAGLWVLGSEGSFSRIGDIKRRLLPTDMRESNVSGAPEVAMLALDPTKAPFAALLSDVTVETATKEHWTHLENAGLAPTAIADEKLGAVRDATGSPIRSVINPAATLRYQRRLYVDGTLSSSPLQLTSHETSIDAHGNTRMVTGPLTIGVEVEKDPTAPLTDISTSFSNTSIDSTLTTALTAGLTLTVDAPAQVYSGTLLQLGSGNAFEQAVLGTTTITALTAFAAQVAVQQALLATQLSALAGLEGPTPKGGFFAAAAAAAVGTQAAALALVNAINPALSLSTKVFVE